MAKLAVINRQAKREAMVKKYAERRKQLQAIIRDPKATEEAVDAARAKLQSLPRDNLRPIGCSVACLATSTQSSCVRCARNRNTVTAPSSNSRPTYAAFLLASRSYR